MSWNERDLGDWTGRTVVITGANSGIGLAAATVLARHGAHVQLACRDPRRAADAARRIPGSTTAALDLSDLDSVAAFQAPDRIDALVCNAGVMGGVYLPSPQGHERQMATNHLGHALLVKQLWSQLEESRGRVVVVSSIAARGGRLTAASTAQDLVDPQPYEGQQVYANTKQANLLYAQELHRRAVAVGSPVSAVVVHPGVSNTALFSRQQVDSGHPRLAPLAKAVGAIAFSSARAGARPTLRGLDAMTPSGAFVGPRLLGQARGRPHLLAVYASGRDPAVGRRLWELTEQVLGTRLPPVHHDAAVNPPQR